MNLKVNAAVVNNIGGRKNNEDNFYLNGHFMEREQMDKGGEFHTEFDKPVQIYAVCDGMGGAEFGEEASLTSVKSLKKYAETCPQPESSVYLKKMVDETSREVDRVSLDREMPSGSCGSTLAMIVLSDWCFRTVNVGDSRVYRLRGGALERMTKDHSEVQQLIDMHELTEEQAFTYSRRNVITKHLGMPTGERALLPTISPRIDLKEKDRFLLCSDGVSDVLRDEEIRGLLAEEDTPSEIAKKIVRTVLKYCEQRRLNSDNITAIVLEVESVGSRDNLNNRIKKLNILRAAAAAAGAVFAGGVGYVLAKLIKAL